MDSKAVAKLADKYAKAREARLAEQKKVDKLKESESQLAAQLMGEMREGEMTSVGGKAHLITYRRKPKAVAKDWGQLQHFIRENDAFDIMEARLNTRALAEREENGEVIPGMEWFQVESLSVAKAKT